jgi:hypothetical protein
MFPQQPVGQQITSGFAQPFPPTPNYLLESPTHTAGFSPFSSGPGTYPQGFGQHTGYDESYFVGLFPELMGPGFVDGGYAAGLGQGVAGGNGFEDALGFWGFRNSWVGIFILEMEGIVMGGYLVAADRIQIPLFNLQRYLTVLEDTNLWTLLIMTLAPMVTTEREEGAKFCGVPVISY